MRTATVNWVTSGTAETCGPAHAPSRKLRWPTSTRGTRYWLGRPAHEAISSDRSAFRTVRVSALGGSWGRQVDGTQLRHDGLFRQAARAASSTWSSRLDVKVGNRALSRRSVLVKRGQQWLHCRRRLTFYGEQVSVASEPFLRLECRFMCRRIRSLRAKAMSRNIVWRKRVGPAARIWRGLGRRASGGIGVMSFGHEGTG